MDQAAHEVVLNVRSHEQRPGELAREEAGAEGSTSVGGEETGLDPIDPHAAPFEPPRKGMYREVP